MQTTLVDKDLLNNDEIKWINAYHKEILEKVRPQLVEFKDERAIAWLEKSCKAI